MDATRQDPAASRVDGLKVLMGVVTTVLAAAVIGFGTSIASDVKRTTIAIVGLESNVKWVSNALDKLTAKVERLEGSSGDTRLVIETLRSRIEALERKQ